jgi:hypothetical protein
LAAVVISAAQHIIASAEREPELTPFGSRAGDRKEISKIEAGIGSGPEMAMQWTLAT